MWMGEESCLKNPLILVNRGMSSLSFSMKYFNSSSRKENLLEEGKHCAGKENFSNIPQCPKQVHHPQHENLWCRAYQKGHIAMSKHWDALWHYEIGVNLNFNGISHQCFMVVLWQLHSVWTEMYKIVSEGWPLVSDYTNVRGIWDQRLLQNEWVGRSRCLFFPGCAINNQITKVNNISKLWNQIANIENKFIYFNSQGIGLQYS